MVLPRTQRRFGARPSGRSLRGGPDPVERPRDRRYGSRRWRRLAKRILLRDRYICRVAPGCPEPATVADHIIPASPELADSLFFSEANLRAACRQHNIARGVAARLERETSGAPSEVVTRTYGRAG